MASFSPKPKPKKTGSSAKVLFNARYDKTHKRFYVRVPDDLRPFYQQGVFTDFDGEADAKAFADQENKKYETDISPKERTSALSYLERCQKEFGYEGTLYQMAKEKYEALKGASKKAEEVVEEEITLEEIRKILVSELEAPAENKKTRHDHHGGDDQFLIMRTPQGAVN